jgi:hypothetical protein
VKIFIKFAIDMLFRKKIILLLAVTGFWAILHAGARVSEFNGRRENNTVVLEWATDEETDLQKFVVQRSSDNVNWNTVGEVLSKSGSSTTRQSYSFTDRNIFKNQTSSFYYSLVLVDRNGQTTKHDVIVSVSGNSGIRHTWGSIKAIFR